MLIRISKGLRRGTSIKNRPGLQLKRVPTRDGRYVYRWVRTHVGSASDTKENNKRLGMSPQEIAEASFESDSIFWRVQPIGQDLSDSHESWPWGMDRDEAEELGLILPGVACTGDPEELVEYWESRGGVGDGYEVVVFRGRYTGDSGDSDVAVPQQVLMRLPYDIVRDAVRADDYSLLNDA